VTQHVGLAGHGDGSVGVGAAQLPPSLFIIPKPWYEFLLEMTGVTPVQCVEDLKLVLIFNEVTMG
jgi:hypothetical protein